MKVWCSRDKDDGTRAMWGKEPEISEDGAWRCGDDDFLTDDILAEGVDMVAGIWLELWPKGVKNGQCVKCTLKRLEVDDEKS